MKEKNRYIYIITFDSSFAEWVIWWKSSRSTLKLHEFAWITFRRFCARFMQRVLWPRWKKKMILELISFSVFFARLRNSHFFCFNEKKKKHVRGTRPHLFHVEHSFLGSTEKTICLPEIRVRAWQMRSSMANVQLRKKKSLSSDSRD